MEADIPAPARPAAEKIQPMTLTQRELEVKYSDLAIRFDALQEKYRILYATSQKAMRELAEFFIVNGEA